jgi:hypothetical protein
MAKDVHLWIISSFKSIKSIFNKIE